MHEIEIDVHGRGTFQTHTFAFPGGELQVSIPGLEEVPDLRWSPVTVTARLQSPAALIQLMLVTEILDRMQGGGDRTLIIPYFPYARQDRVMRGSEAFSLKPVATLINSLLYSRVIVCDPHSDVTPALLDRAEVVSQGELIASHTALFQYVQPAADAVIIAPDAGAVKKASQVSTLLQRPLVTASKLRDTATGEITGTAISDPAAVTGRPCLIVDDICDGGRTFVELAKVLREAGAAWVWLYVTHGIFSKGLGVFGGLIDAVFTTDSFTSAPQEVSNVCLYTASIQPALVRTTV